MNNEPRLEDISDYNNQDKKKLKSVCIIILSGLIITLSYLTWYIIDEKTPLKPIIVKKYNIEKK